MGITGLWEVLGKGEIWSIADYAAEHFEQHKRPLRIAVDEACWRFTNLTPDQVQKIREGEPAANPVEKVILWRVLRLLKLNVQLIFVNDGPRRPWKRNKRGGGKLDFELTRLTHKLLDLLKVPYHQAPGEAEAECARLQALGVVDAVWSDDGDSLMFGCGTLIKQHKVGQERIKDQVRVYNAESVTREHALNTDSLVLFAMLAGGDYNVEGLRGCGPKTAALVARRDGGLARSLCHASQSDLPAWRQTLQESLSRLGKPMEVPWTFPEWKALGYYRSPTVSTPEQLQNLRGLKHGWDRPIDQVKLRVLLRERFNFSTREFMKHITPIFLVRSLARASSEQKERNLVFGVQSKQTRRKKTEGDQVETKAEVKIKFSPMSVVKIDLSQPPPEENWDKFSGKSGTPYDPTQNIDCEILSCFLRHGLPDGALDTTSEQTKSTSRKRKRDDESPRKSSPSKKRSSASIVEPKPNLNPSLTRTTKFRSSSKTADKGRGRPPKEPVSTSNDSIAKPLRGRTQDAGDDIVAQKVPNAPSFKQPRVCHGVYRPRPPACSIWALMIALLNPTK